MTTTNVSTTLPSLQMQADPLFGSVERILQRDYIGSWADASLEYARIRRGMLWTELRTLTGSSASKANQERAAKLLKELQSVAAELSDTAPSSSTSFAAAESIVKRWTPAPAPPKPAAKKIVNTFAALTEDSDEE